MEDPEPTLLDRLLGGRLWRDLDFVLLWAGQTVSVLGSQVTLLALPAAAILMLHASPFQVGLLGAFEFLAFPTLGLVAGVYADRVKRRWIMIICDLGRMLALGSIPTAYALGWLSMPLLYAVALLTGVFTVFFDIAYQSYLPALIPRPKLIEGNSKLEVSRSVAQVAGPAIAGLLLQIVGAARAIAVDAASFAVSVLSLWAIRRPEPAPAPGTASGRRGFWVEMWEGMRVVLGNPTLWKIAGCTATSNLGSNIIFAVYLIFVFRYLHLSPGVVGLIFAAGSAGGLLGAVSAGALARRFGLGRALVLGIAGSFAYFLVPLAQLGASLLLLVTSFLVMSFGGTVYNVNQVSLRQTITPDHVQGRMNATVRTMIWGTIPIGSFVGGILGERFGVVPALVVGAIVATLAGIWILAGPVHLREQPVVATA
ncbi:MAG TPA: MFS transporter [Candidatus Dormibacteraeota bacterium]|nr:MFS transporter [Candidatus Dormibacteraeota bacterium]